MTGARHFARANSRKRAAGLRERRAFDREQRLDLQDAQLADTSRHISVHFICACGAPARAGSCVCDDCYQELGGES